MPPRIRLRPLTPILSSSTSSSTYICARCSYATATATATAPVNVPSPTHSPHPELSRHHPLQPPSYRSPSYLRSQKLRAYVSLLQTTPLMLFFQHNNLKASEWAAIRRELARAVSKVDNTLASEQYEPISDAIKLQVISTTIFEPALRITDYFHADSPPAPELLSKDGTLTFARPQDDPTLTHTLSSQAYAAAVQHKGQHPLTPLMKGSLAVLVLPTVSPQHLAAALSVLSPQKPSFPAPSRRLAPGYYDAAVQDGLRKLLLLGARVEGRTFDLDGVRWVGSINGGIDGLRAQLVSLLQMAGVGLTGALEGLGKTLWMTMESRRQDMEEKAGGGGGGGGGDAAAVNGTGKEAKK